MKFVTRPETPPEILSHPQFREMRQAYLVFLKLDKERQSQTRLPDSSLPDLPGLLPAIAGPFKGKCAFCAIEKATQVYRFRPTGHAHSPPGTSKAKDGLSDGSDEPSKIHYGWLASAWENLYPICDNCLPDDPEAFPVVGERLFPPLFFLYEDFLNANTGSWTKFEPDDALLIDPCRIDPAEHLVLKDDGTLKARTAKGRATIKHFKLNRLGLVVRRSKGVVQQVIDPLPGETGMPRRKWELAKIEIENFKAIEHLVLDMPRIPPVAAKRAQTLLILGENAAGKSTILEAVALAMVDDKTRLAMVPDPSVLLLNPQLMGAPGVARRARATVSLTFVASVAGTAEPEFFQRTLHITPAGTSVEGNAPDLPKVLAYGAYRHFVNGVRGRHVGEGVVTLFRSDSLLSNPHDWLLKLDTVRFNEVIATLRYVFGVDFDAVRRRDGTCFVVTKTGGVEQETPLMAVSSGFRTVLSLVCDALRWLMSDPATRTLQLVNMPALILIDEVEAHLHPRWKMAIVDGLRQALPGAVFLATTHDPLCLRRANPGEVRVISRQNTPVEAELPVFIEALTELPDMGTLTIDQLLTADFFGLGDTDDPKSVKAFEDWMEQTAGSGTASEPPPAIAALIERLRDDLPVGRTEVERIVHEAVRVYLATRQRARPIWRAEARERIVKLLEQI